MATMLTVSPPASAIWPDLAILSGHLAPASLALQEQLPENLR
jgi:hypothetical protein